MEIRQQIRDQLRPVARSALQLSGSRTTDFVFTMRTSGAAELVTLPATSASNNFDIDWGDGSTATITSASPTHTYATAGDYEIRISGTCPIWRFDNGGDCTKLIKVSNLGKVGWTELERAFHGCSNMIEFSVGNTDTSNVVNFYNFLTNCSSLINPPRLNGLDTSNCVVMRSMLQGLTAMTSPPDLSGFDTSKVTNMYAMVANWPLAVGTLDLSTFNTSKVVDMQLMAWNNAHLDIDVSSFDISSLTNAGNMFLASAFSTENYDKLLVAWEAQVEKLNVPFHAGTAKYSTGAPTTARGVLTGASSWTITDGGQAPATGGNITDVDGNNITDADGNPLTYITGSRFELVDSSGNYLVDAAGSNLVA